MSLVRYLFAILFAVDVLCIYSVCLINTFQHGVFEY